MNRAERIAGQRGDAGDFRVPSDSTPGRWYYLVYDGVATLGPCRCLAGLWGRDCHHVDDVWELILLERAAITAREMAAGRMS